jgi:glycosyltransferase involved in cell wall biosynthesis
VFTTSDVREPRAVRHAVALATRFPNAEISFIDLHPGGELMRSPKRLAGHPNITRHSVPVPHRKNNAHALVLERGMLAGAQLIGQTKRFLEYSCSIQSNILRRAVGKIAADVYVGHNIGALSILSALKSQFGGVAIYDNMEVYWDMPEQSESDRRRIRAIETAYLPDCDLVLTTTEIMNDFIKEKYDLKNCSFIYNCPPKIRSLRTKLEGFHLYWRNTIIGLGDRGLGDILQALVHLPNDVVLHLQGRSSEGMHKLHELAHQLGIAQKVKFHEQYEPAEAVTMASPYSVGLCLERNTCVNHRLTASNKIFDYHMAGLAVVCSDMPALRQIVLKSRAGLTFRNSDPDDLCTTIYKLYENKTLLSEMQSNARAFAMDSGNEERQMELFISKVDQLISPNQPPRSSRVRLTGSMYA